MNKHCLNNGVLDDRAGIRKNPCILFAIISMRRKWGVWNILIDRSSKKKKKKGPPDIRNGILHIPLSARENILEQFDPWGTRPQIIRLVMTKKKKDHMKQHKTRKQEFCYEVSCNNLNHNLITNFKIQYLLFLDSRWMLDYSL